MAGRAVRGGGRERLIAGAAALALGVVLAAAHARADGALHAGNHAPPIDLADLEGRRYAADWKGGAALTALVFFDPQSSSCLMALNFLDALYQKARDYGFAAVAVESKGRGAAEVSRSMERYCTVYRPLPFPVLADPTFRTGRLFGVADVPLLFLIEGHGVVVARVEGFDRLRTVEVTRRVEQLLRREPGSFSPVLREVGVSEGEEREAGARLAESRSSGGEVRTLVEGDRVTGFSWTDVAGRQGAWDWPAKGAPARAVLFWNGLSLPTVQALAYLDDLARRGADAGFGVVAVESSGLDAAGTLAGLERYRRVHPLLAYPVVADPEKRIVGIFGVSGSLPELFLVGADGVVLDHEQGFNPGIGAQIAGRLEAALRKEGRALAPAGRVTTEAAPPAGGEEAPSIRRQSEQEESFRANLGEADAAFADYEFSRALPLYLKCLEARPKDPHVLERLARIYDRLGVPDKALDAWGRLLAEQPGNQEARARVEELRKARRGD